MPLNNPVASNIPTFQLLDDILTILGSTTTSLWPLIENTGSIVRTYGESAHIFTMTDGGSGGFLPVRHAGGIQSYHFDKTDSMHGAGEDHADFTFGSGAADSAFSVGAWVYRDVASTLQAILAKFDVAGTLREWQFAIDASNNIEFTLYDESADATEIGASDTALTLNIWQFVCVTYDGAQAAPAVNFYLDGASDGSGTAETGAYVAMEDTVTPLMLAAADDTAAATNEMDGRIALPFICGAELTAANISALYGIGRLLLGLA